MQEVSNNWLQSFVEKNVWSLLALVVAIAMFYVTTQNSIKVNAEDINQLTTKVDKLQILVERVIVLEEHDQATKEDISDIKKDIRSIKEAVDKLN